MRYLYILYSPVEADSIPENFTGIIRNDNGSIYHMYKGELHRTDGPAIEQYNGVNHYYLNNVKITEMEHKEYIILERRKICFPSLYPKD